MSTYFTDQAKCWYLSQDGIDDREWIAHYATEAEAREHLEEGDEYAPRECTRRCVRLKCDSCGQFEDSDGMSDTGMHIDPAELDDWLHMGDWSVSERDPDRHHCHECPLTVDPGDEEEDEFRPVRDMSREPGPDDVPLFQIEEAPND